MYLILDLQVHMCMYDTQFDQSAVDLGRVLKITRREKISLASQRNFVITIGPR